MKWNKRDDEFLMKLLGARWPRDRIAQRMGRRQVEVDERIIFLVQKQSEVEEKSGWGEAAGEFTLMCQLYEQLGNQLKKMSILISSQASAHDLEAVGLSTEKALLVKKNFIVLKPFSSSKIEETLKD